MRHSDPGTSLRACSEKTQPQVSKYTNRCLPFISFMDIGQIYRLVDSCSRLPTVLFSLLSRPSSKDGFSVRLSFVISFMEVTWAHILSPSPYADLSSRNSRIESWLYSLPSLHAAMGAVRGFYKKQEEKMISQLEGNEALRSMSLWHDQRWSFYLGQCTKEPYSSSFNIRILNSSLLLLFDKFYTFWNGASVVTHLLWKSSIKKGDLL